MGKLKKLDKIFEDLLDKEFVNAFQPIFFIQRVVGVLGINIAYRFVTPPTRLYKIYSCVTWMIISACIVHILLCCRTRFDSLSTDIPLKVGILMNGIISLGLVWKSLFCSGNFNSQLYVKLQRIERSLKMKNAKLLNRKLYMISLSWAIMSVILFIVWIIVFHKYLTQDLCPTASLASVFSCASFFVIFHIFTILYFISERVQYVNVMLTRAKLDVTRKGVVYSTSDYVISPSNKVSEELVHGMYYILDSFADAMDIFQHAIFLFTFQMLAWQLLTMQNLVISFKMQMSVNIPSFLCTLPSSTVFMGLMLTICFTSQNLTNGFETCEELCTALTSSLDEGESRWNAKRITLLVKGKRNATVFDIFTLDTQLPFYLLAITASYTIVLLQFAAL